MRKTQLKNVICDFTLKEWEYILKEQNNTCNMCGKEFTEKKQPTQDHIYPVSKGGNHTKSNIQALCFTCNLIKGNKILSR